MRHLAALVLALLLVITVLSVPAIAADAPPATPPAEAEWSASGLAWVVLEPGRDEPPPFPDDRVEVRFAGWQADGTPLAGATDRERTVIVPLDRALDGFAEGVVMMRPGETRRLWVPEALAYKGEAGKPTGTLIFDVTLEQVLSAPPTPADVAAPPADAEVGKGGLASKVLVPGSGTVHPRKRSRVEVHYSGWTTDGELFDSSHLRGEPAVFPLDAVIRGWTEGLQLMVEGETRRFWIPEKLAYKGEPGKPAGMLVFDVELLRIVEE